MAGGKQPGVMLYFTLRPGLKALSLEEKGMLWMRFSAMVKTG